jgi:hypothetical protein
MCHSLAIRENMFSKVPEAGNVDAHELCFRRFFSVKFLLPRGAVGSAGTH